MRTTLLAVLTLSASFLFAQDVRVEDIGKSPTEARFVRGGAIRMDLCSSGIDVIGEDSDRIRVSFDNHRGNDLKVRIETTGNRAELKVTGCPRNNFQLRIEIPKTSDLYVRMFAGQLEIKGIAGDKDVQLHAGELDMEIGEAKDYSRVEASVNTGEIDASPFGVSKGGLFRSFDRSGPGKYRLHAHVGAGQLTLN